VYQFFSIYANLAIEAGTFDPSAAPPRPVTARDTLDRWIAHQLETTTAAVTAELDGYRLYEASRALLAFVDDLSNWYVRRSRARFWGEGRDAEDALWTLYEVLLRTSHLLAPFVPFHAEGLYRALTVDVGRADLPDSVHLAAWPEVDPARLDPALADDMAIAREVASLGLAARAATKLKVRQPLRAATVVLADGSRQPAVHALAALVTDELNVRELRYADDAAGIVEIVVKPNFRTLGRRLGGRVQDVARALAAKDPSETKAALDSGTLAVDLDGETIALTADEVEVRVTPKAGFEAASSRAAVVALATDLDEDLIAEGFVRELTNRVQTLRKDENLGYAERLALWIDADPESSASIRRFEEYLAGETLCRSLAYGAPSDASGLVARTWDVDGRAVRGWIRRGG
jgi:isoleucyl-tRNA synthetase